VFPFSFFFTGELISEECVHSDKFMLSDLPDYFIGEEGDLKHYKEVSLIHCCFVVCLTFIFDNGEF
jgi:hypothetical protein